MYRQMTSSVDLPVELAWLQEQINRVYGTNSKVTKCDGEPGGEGKGFMSFITKCTMTYDPVDDRLPKAIIIKRPTLEKIKNFEFIANQTFESLKDMHNREVYAYEYFNKYGAPPIPIPKLIYVDKITTEGTGMLILEFSEGRSLSFNEDTSVGQLLAMAEHFGHLQAYALKHPEVFGDLEPLAMDPFAKAAPILPTAVKALREAFPEEFTISDTKLEELIQERNESAKIFTGQLGQYKRCFALCDVQPNNILWKTDENGQTTDEISAFVDFQLIFIGCAGLDLGAFTAMTHRPEGVPAVKDKLIKRFHDTLLASSEGCDKDLLPNIDEVHETFDRSYRERAIAGIAFAFTALGMREVMGMTEERLRTVAQGISQTLA